MIRRLLARAYWAASRWNYVAEPFDRNRPGILIAAPHTSNWDLLLMVGIAWRAGISPAFLAKKELFSGPVGWLVKRLGGVSVDRQNPEGLLEELGRRFGAAGHLVIAPEGTRNRVDGWKSGFYRLAVSTELPITLGFVDRTTMTAGLGPTLHMTGDVRADMDQIRTFYEGKTGVRAGQESPIRLSTEG